MHCKCSAYNFIIENPDGDQLIMNMKTQAMAKIKKGSSSFDNGFFSNKSSFEISKDNAKPLLRRGFIVDANFDESKSLEMKYNEMIYGNETLSVQILPTFNCNFRCTYCFENPDKYEMSENTVQAIIRFLERNIPRCKQFRLSLFGGEPLLCTDSILSIAQAANTICQSNRVPMYGEISTNGYNLSLPVFNTLLKNRITSYQICLDGPPRLHNQSRPHYCKSDSYERIFENLCTIKREVKFNTFSILLRSNITPQNFPYMKEHITELGKYFKNDRRFSVIFQCVRNWGGERIQKDQILPAEETAYESLYAFTREKGLHCMNQGAFAPIVGNCQACRKNGYIFDPHGNIHKCSIAMFEPKHKEICCIGKIDDSGQAIIDENKLAEWIVENDVSRKSECKSCVLYPFCMGGHCAYSKNIKKEKGCNLYLISALKEYVLERDACGEIASF